ncbi:Cyanovirin-N [Mycena venus]|uniref:Cyanovirin-N n=1 Tax=Mycena venus TaxID=2733690 RepID=A0A8H7DBI6_9AGAR|nr:Cyanovirin-N [Mycena venus]
MPNFAAIKFPHLGCHVAAESQECCLAAVGSLRSTISLNNCVGNNNGDLTAGFSGFTSSCTNIRLINGVDLTAQCTSASGIVVGSQLNLDKFVDNNNGQLAC